MAQITLAEATTEVSTRLGDPNNVFFTQDEIYLYLCEALQVLNALTGFLERRVLAESHSSVHAELVCRERCRDSAPADAYRHGRLQHHRVSPSGTRDGRNVDGNESVLDQRSLAVDVAAPQRNVATCGLQYGRADAELHPEREYGSNPG